MTEQPQYEWQRPDFRTFEIGDVFSRAFTGIRARGRDAAIISFALLFAPGIVINAISFLQTRSLEGMLLLLVVVGFVAFILASILVPAILIQIFTQSFWGEHVTLDHAVRIALQRFWAILAGSILAGLGMIGGFLALIVPAFILYCGWYVFMPVVIGERQGAIDSLGRSWELTRGYKGQIFLIFIISLVIVMILGGILGAIAGAFVGVEAINMSASANPGSVFFFAAAQSLAGVIGTIISCAFVSSTYYELLQVRGEIDDEASDIFAPGDG